MPQVLEEVSGQLVPQARLDHRVRLALSGQQGQVVAWEQQARLVPVDPLDRQVPLVRQGQEVVWGLQEVRDLAVRLAHQGQ